VNVSEYGGFIHVGGLYSGELTFGGLGYLIISLQLLFNFDQFLCPREISQDSSKPHYHYWKIIIHLLFKEKLDCHSYVLNQEMKLK
jgi:hypothetical protein